MTRHRAPRRPALLHLSAPAAALLLGACQTITVPPNDGTGPYLFVTLPDAGRLGARYAPTTPGGDYEPLNATDNIDPSRSLFIQPADADDPISFRFFAFDHDSGISRGTARVTVFFVCDTNDAPDHPPLRHNPQPVDIYRTFGRPAAPNTTTDVSASVTITFTLRQLWHEAHCPATVRAQGEILGIRLTYYATADNNATAPVLGTFRYNNDVGIRQTYLWYPRGG